MYERYYDLYMKNMVTLVTLEKLVKAGLLTHDEVDTMSKDRLGKYGF